MLRRKELNLNPLMFLNQQLYHGLRTEQAPKLKGK